MLLSETYIYIHELYCCLIRRLKFIRWILSIIPSLICVTSTCSQIQSEKEKEQPKTVILKIVNKDMENLAAAVSIET